MYGLDFLRLRPRTLTREIRELCVLTLKHFNYVYFVRATFERHPKFKYTQNVENSFEA